MKNSNPVVQEVVDRFNTVHKLSKIYVTGNSAQKGLNFANFSGNLL